MTRFIHLRAHTAYSLLEGMIHVYNLINLCKTYNMPAVAITDSNNMFCALEASLEAKKQGIQLIPGFECDLETGGRIVLLSQSYVGYKNLLTLVSRMYTRNNYNDQVILKLSDLEQYNHDVLLLTGGVNGVLYFDISLAESMLIRLKNIFHDRLYVEIDRPDHYNKEKELFIVHLAYQYKIPLVATNTFFFENVDMIESWNTLRCIATGQFLENFTKENTKNSYYFKSEEEMVNLFVDLPEAIDNTVTIAQRCYYMPEPHDPILPSYTKNSGKTEEESLNDMAIAGLKVRGKFELFEYRSRLQEELTIIINMGFAGYFLIVADFVQWAKEHDIPVGPGRGSGVGSLVAWALRITELDPLQFNLLFERFLNPERVSMPDFDIDICGEKRDQVINYMQQTYGFVAGIITFGKLQARAVLRDVGRVLGMPYGYVDRICRLVPQDPTNPPSLKEAIKQESLLQNMISDDLEVQRLFDIAIRLEGLFRHASTHAGGIVIADRPLSELVPLYRDPRSDLPVTGFHMKYIEMAGLVKFDLLGLKTLTMLEKASQLIERYYGHSIALDKIPLNDLQTYRMLAQGNTVGVFQLESQGMRDILMQIKPTVFEDLIAVVALYRPGPMENLSSYIRRKKQEEPIVYEHPLLENILRETVGIPVYQEQVMQMAQKLAGYTLGSADLLRRAMGKKIQKEMDEHRTIFCQGAFKTVCMSESQANHIFDQMSAFAGYGFNKGHAAAYAYLAYQTAWLKANYPIPFLAASMTLDIHNIDKLNIFRMEAARMKIKILPPDIQYSDALFDLEKQEDDSYAIRYGLGALKNVGIEAAQKLVHHRMIGERNIFSFLEKLPSDILSKRSLESLIKSGTLDFIECNRRVLYDSLDLLINYIGSKRENHNSNLQGNLFQDSKILQPSLLKKESWSEFTCLQHEFESIGMYLTKHPLESYRVFLNSQGVITYSDFFNKKMRDGILSGVVEKRRQTRTSRGGKMAFLTLSDETGVFEVTFFSEIWKKNRELAIGDQIKVFVTKSDDRLLVGKVESLNSLKKHTDIYINLLTPESIHLIASILKNIPTGEQKIFCSFEESDKRMIFQIPGTFFITEKIIHELKQVIGVALLEKKT